MSFIFINADNSEIIDILPDRRKFMLERYFNKFPKEVRNNVKYIVVDMYSPYISLSEELFRNAKIVIDPFHIVQNFTRAFNMTRVQIMKKYDTSSFEYKVLKRYWKLLLKPKSKLKLSDFHHFIHYKHWMSEYEVVKNILAIDETLKICYEFMQSIMLSVSIRDYNLFTNTLNAYRGSLNLSEKMITALNTGYHYSEYIENTMNSSYSNGRIEGIINKIKTIKRSSYGYRSFNNLRLRILLSFHKFNYVHMSKTKRIA